MVRAAVRSAVVAIVDDDPIMGESLVQRLSLEGYGTAWWKAGREAARRLAQQEVDLVLCDIRLPDIDGEQLYRELLPVLGKTPIIFITAFGELEQAVRLMRLGANDYLTKPFDIELLLEKLSSLLEGSARAELQPSEALGCSPAMQRIEAVLRRVKDLDATVLLSGETGVGKEVAARFLHLISNRAERPFISVNCGALPAELVESQLFGHERGAFTGAHVGHRGFVELAADGILFLDEIAELPLVAQAKLLRLLDDRRFYRVGGEKELGFTARVVAATNADLAQRVEAGQFRKDLFYRINVVALRLPPLRDRREEILPLARGFIAEFGKSFDRSVEGLAPEAEAAAVAHAWPGNVRELRNRIERAAAIGAGGLIAATELFPETVPLASGARPKTLAAARDAAERLRIEAALRETGGQILAAAASLGVSRTTLWEKMRRLGIQVG